MGGRGVVSIDKKLEIMKEYVEKTKKAIKADTVYKTYKIGQWQNWIRTIDRLGKKVGGLTPQLEEEFEKIGVLNQLKRRKRTTDERKLEIFKKLIEEDPDIKITNRKFSKNGIPVSMYKDWIIAKHNRGKLSDDLTDEFKKIGIVGYPKDMEKLIVKYQLRPNQIMEIIREYGSIEEFEKKYKNFEGNSDTNKLLSNLKEREFIPIDVGELSCSIVSGYSRLCLAIFGLKRQTYFYSIEQTDKALLQIDEKERYIIKAIYGLDGNKPKTQTEIVKMYLDKGEKISFSTIKDKERNALRKLKYFELRNLILLGNMTGIQKELEEMKEIYNNNSSQFRFMGYETLDELEKGILRKEAQLMRCKNAYKKWMSPETSVFIYDPKREEEMNLIVEEFRSRRTNNIGIEDKMNNIKVNDVEQPSDDLTLTTKEEICMVDNIEDAEKIDDKIGIIHKIYEMILLIDQKIDKLERITSKGEDKQKELRDLREKKQEMERNVSNFLEEM